MKLCRVMLVALVVAPPCLAQRTLDCSALQNGTRMDEKATLATAPHGAARLSPHRLDVRWAHGVRSFVDVPPYGVGEEAGGRNFYCGYDPVTAMHLIYHYDEDGVDGLLLDDSTGAVLPAGYSVLYAPDHSRYLAIVQPEGWDGQEWRIYLADGRPGGRRAIRALRRAFQLPGDAPSLVDRSRQAGGGGDLLERQ